MKIIKRNYAGVDVQPVDFIEEGDTDRERITLTGHAASFQTFTGSFEGLEIIDRNGGTIKFRTDKVSEIEVEGGATTPGPFTTQALKDILKQDFFFDVLGVSGGSGVPIDAVVDPAGNGDYLTLGAATAAGKCSIYVRKHPTGTVETGDVFISSFCKIWGESSGAIINFPAGVGLKNTAVAASVTGGTITVTNNSVTVVGVGTAFAAGDVGKHIKIGTSFYKINVFNNPTSIDLENPYQGKTVSALDYFIREMITGIEFETLTFKGAGVSDSLIAFDGVLNSSMRNVLTDGAAANNVSLFECGSIVIDNSIHRFSTASGVKVAKSCQIKIGKTDSYSQQSHGFILDDNCQGITIDESFATDTDNHGFNVLNGCTEVTIKGCHANRINNRGFNVDGTCIDITTSNCQAHNCTGTAFENLSLRSKTEGCTMSFCIAGVRATGGEATVSNCNAANIFPSTTYFVGGPATMTSRIINCKDQNSVKTIRLDGDNNVVSNCASIDCQTGIEIFGGNGDNNRIVNNTIEGATVSALTITGNGNKLSGNVLSGNTNNYTFTNATNTEIEGLIYNELQTVDATTTTIATIALPGNNSQYIFDVSVSAMQNTQAKFGSWKRILVVQKIAGVTTIGILDAVTDSQTGLVPGSVTAAVVGTDVALQVTGNALETFDWVATHKGGAQSPIF